MQRALLLLALLSILAVASPLLAASNRLFLNFDGDPSLLGWGKVKPFNAHDLNSAWGASETSALRSGVLQEVRKDYREFDIEITDVKPVSGNYYTLGIDGASHVNLDQSVDFGQSSLDYGSGRVYGGSYSLFPEFQGANATLERFTNGLSGTTSHESGHLYFLQHSDAIPTSGEFSAGRRSWHDVMASGENNLVDMTQRATINRNFGQKDYEILAANLGLNTQVLLNWDFRNPNATAANDFHIKFLSQHSSLTVESEYGGDPFGVPSLARSNGQIVHQGKNYYEYELTWSGGQGVAPGAKFHTGISFKETNDFLVTDSFLTNNGNPLALFPRAVSITGDPQPGGSYAVQLLNESDTQLSLDSVRVRLLPQMPDLQSLAPDAIERPLNLDGKPIPVLLDLKVPAGFDLAPGASQQIEVEALAHWIDRKLIEFGDPAGALGDGAGPGADGDPRGPSALYGMFPSAYLYVTANAVLHNQDVFDPATGGFVRQDLGTQVFAAFAGSRQLVPPPGDVNGDGKIDLNDFGVLKDHFGAGTTRAQGDLNADGHVDLTDFGILKDNFGKSLDDVSVPEPSTFLLAALAGVGLLAFRRRGVRRDCDLEA